MINFNVGDKVITEDGEIGEIHSLQILKENYEVQSYVVKIKNKLVEYLPGGLSLIDFENLYGKLLPCKSCCSVPFLNKETSYYFFECKCDCWPTVKNIDEAVKNWNEIRGKKKIELKKGDVVYIRAIVDDPNPDVKNDIYLITGISDKKAQDSFENGSSCRLPYNENEVFTIEQLRHIRK